jgi:hypothetical protein
MSDTPRGSDWWRASDGKWYPPEQHPQYRPPPPPPTPSNEPRERVGSAPPASRRREKSGTSIWKVALGVALGLFLFILACAAIIGGAAKDATEKKAAVVRVEADPEQCWSGSIGEATREGCGPASFNVETTFGNVVSANVQKTDDSDRTVSIVVQIDGKEVARNSTSAAYGVAQATSSP